MNSPRSWKPYAYAVGLVVVAIATWQVVSLTMAHSSLDAYAAFRGCATLTNRTSAGATCVLPSGKTLPIVEFRNEWYLKGDLPLCWNGICL